MAIITKSECPPAIQSIWDAAESLGFSDFIYLEREGILMAESPNATIEDDRVPITWEMYELRDYLQGGLAP